MSSTKRVHYAIGVDLGGTNARVGVVSSQGKLLNSQKYPIPQKRGKHTLLEHLAMMIQESLKWCAEHRIKPKGIGLGCPGVLSIQKGIIFESPNIPEWRNLQIQKYFQKRFHLPVTLENDANVAALGELWVGAGRKSQNGVCVTLGTGVGGGIILNGDVWHGANESAGEIGHMVVNHKGEKCKCGNWGCLEVYTSATGIVRRTKKSLKNFKGKSLLKKIPKLTSQAVYQAAAKGDKLARKITLETAEILGAGLTSLVHMLNPEIIIIGGGVAQSGSLLFKPLKETLRKRCFAQSIRNLKVVPAKLGDQAGMIGAAKAFFHHAKV